MRLVGAGADGVLFFAGSVCITLAAGLELQQENRLVWAPDLLGSVCFLVSGALA